MADEKKNKAVDEGDEQAKDDETTESTEDESTEAKDEASDEDESKEDESGDEEDATKEEESTEVTDEALSKMIGAEVAKAVRSTQRKDEKTVSKPIGGAAVVSADPFESMTPQQRGGAWLKAFYYKDQATLDKLNERSMSVYRKDYKLAAKAGLIDEQTGKLVTKAGYANEGTAADGSVLVPPADFVAEVARLETSYGVSRANGVSTRTVNSNAATIRKKTEGNFGLAFTETAEGAAKSGVKMSFTQQTVTLRKFAAIAPVTDELVDDAAVDIFNEFTIDYARAKAYQEDKLVFTDATTGIIHQTGLAKAISVGSTWAALTTFDDFVTAVNSVVPSALPNAKWYLHRGALAVLQTIKDSYNRPLLMPDLHNAQQLTLLGYPVVLTEVLAGTGNDQTGKWADGNNTTFAVFGDLSHSLLIDKGGLELTMLTEGTITGSDSSSINLAQQDMKALRGVIRTNNVVQFPSAYVTLGTGSVS